MSNFFSRLESGANLDPLTFTGTHKTAPDLEQNLEQKLLNVSECLAVVSFDLTKQLDERFLVFGFVVFAYYCSRFGQIPTVHIRFLRASGNKQDFHFRPWTDDHVLVVQVH